MIPMAKSKAKILVVDDNSGIRAALKVLLPIHFSQVEVIPSPNELMSRLAEFRPDVVLLDMNFHTDICRYRPCGRRNEAWGIRLHREAVGQ